MKSRSVRAVPRRHPRTGGMTSGAWVSISRSRVPAVNRNMPEFHRCLPPVDQAGGGLGIRLFHEPRDGVHAGGIRQFGADLDIAVAGFRRRRPHPEGHDFARPGRYGSDLQRGAAARRYR